MASSPVTVQCIGSSSIFAGAAGKGDLDRSADMTLGLRGTNIYRIQTEEVLQTCMERSPSLADRCPHDHPNLTDEQFGSVRVNLFPDE